MHYKYICMFLMRSKSTCIIEEDFPNNEIWTRRSNPKGTYVNYSIAEWY